MFAVAIYSSYILLIYMQAYNMTIIINVHAHTTQLIDIQLTSKLAGYIATQLDTKGNTIICLCFVS